MCNELFCYFREYKEALRQQRAQDVPSVYRTRDEDHSYKTEPNTPTHHMSPSRTVLATSKSDPTPLNSALSSPKHIFDDTSSPKKSPKAKTYSPQIESDHDIYIKPNPPTKTGTGILSHDNVPPANGYGMTNGVSNNLRVASTISYFNGGAKIGTANGVKLNRSNSCGQDVPDKMSFTMRREIDKAKEESEMIDQLRVVSTDIF